MEGVDLAVNAGEFVSLIGASGCGKSTLLRAVMGLQALSAGSIELSVERSEVGFLFQDDALLPWRTSLENVALGLRNHGMSAATAYDHAEKWLASVGLEGFEDRYPRELSGGQRKRVAIAQVLALRPRFLLMDEPFASLDAIVRHYLTDDLLGWVESEALTVLLVTHDLEEAVALSDRVILLGQGPRAQIKGRYDVNLPRPRDVLRAKKDPAFPSIAATLWHDLSDQVQAPESRKPSQRWVVNV